MNDDHIISFLKRWEGFSPTSYYDVSRYSIGYGTRSFEGESITVAEAERRLSEALVSYKEALQQKVTFTPTKTQETALLSALYNLGKHGIDPVIGLANSGHFLAAAALLQTYCYADGKRHPGLVARREAEAALLLMDGRLMGEPRVQYEREYWLMPPDGKTHEFMQVATAAFSQKATIGFSADDAGIGNLDVKRVRLLFPDRQPEGIKEWFDTHYTGIDIVYGYPEPTPAPQNGSESVRRVSGRALVGLHGSADGSWGNPILGDTLEMVKQGRIEAYKALSNEGSDTVRILKDINPDMFIMVRLFEHVLHGEANEFLSASEFADRVGADARAWYAAGVKHFEVHNEPNLTTEGWNTAWRDGAEFAMWWHLVVGALRTSMPDALWGYPGLSPGFSQPGLRYDPIRFYEESWQAQDRADFICVHSYWQSAEGMLGEDEGQWYRKVPHAGKPMMLTEFSNTNKNVQKTEKAVQYVEYYRSLVDIHSAYSFVSTASSGFDSETWRGSNIAAIVGERDGWSD
jgi:GH24 family phage-related lysozyme (muramidase)